MSTEATVPKGNDSALPNEPPSSSELAHPGPTNTDLDELKAMLVEEFGFNPRDLVFMKMMTHISYFIQAYADKQSQQREVAIAEKIHNFADKNGGITRRDIHDFANNLTQQETK